MLCDIQPDFVFCRKRDALAVATAIAMKTKSAAAAADGPSKSKTKAKMLVAEDLWSLTTTAAAAGTATTTTTTTTVDDTLNSDSDNNNAVKTNVNGTELLANNTRRPGCGHNAQSTISSGTRNVNTHSHSNAHSNSNSHSHWHSHSYSHASHAIYTSGSTGKPKAVLVQHASLVSYCLAKASAHKIDAHSRVLLASAFVFDPNLGDVFSTLIAGATLCVVEHEVVRFALLAD